MDVIKRCIILVIVVVALLLCLCCDPLVWGFYCVACPQAPYLSTGSSTLDETLAHKYSHCWPLNTLKSGLYSTLAVGGSLQ